jgi:two-component system sensor histidine kinase KdpD
LAIGARRPDPLDTQQAMTAEDFRQLVHSAYTCLASRLQQVAARQDVAEILVRTSHILRGPLIAIQGEIEALQDFLAADELNPASLRELCDNLQNQVDDIAAQAERMEEAEKTTLGTRGRPWFQRAPLSSLIRKVCSGLSTVARRRSITFSDTSTLRSLPDVEFDWNQMRVVFANLLDNACKYAHGDSLIRIDGQEFDDGAKPWVRIRIQNRGIGIRPSEIETAIFLPSFRGAVRNERRDIEGTGMGLAICKDIVVVGHGGRIRADCRELPPQSSSSQKPGSYQNCIVTFLVELPVGQSGSGGESYANSLG